MVTDNSSMMIVIRKTIYSSIQ